MLVLLPIVFASGILTVLSPCVLPILPIILSSGIDGNKRRINGTVLGLIASFTTFAFILASLVGFLNISADDLRIVASIILGVFGLTMIFPSIWEKIQAKIETIFNISKLKIGGGTRSSGIEGDESSANKDTTTKKGFWGGFLTGFILGIVWTPCVGPIIATVTTLASIQSFSANLFIVLLSYSFGISIPLLLIANGGAKISEKLGWYKQNQEKVRKWFGIIIVLTAIFIFTGAERRFQSLVLDYLPASISNPVGEFEQKFSDQMDFLEKQGEETSMTENKEKMVINKNVKLKIEEDGAKLPLSEIKNGCPFKDCIPSIDAPVFESMELAGKWLKKTDRVFILTHNEITKIYPQRIMNWHEIVNDWFGDEAIAVSFCPLCGTATAFNRMVDSVITEFGVSGKLHNSDLIMYDRYEGSLWQQATGEAITGPAARRDEELPALFLITLDWQQAMEEFPDAEVLSRKTGHSRDYDRYPYGSYETSDSVGFGAPTDDKRLGPKDWVYGIKVGEEAKAYKESDLENISVIKDVVGGTTIVVKNTNGIISFAELETGEEIVPLRSFWFAWAAFNPGTKVY